jgi:hypothetical protein
VVRYPHRCERYVSGNRRSPRRSATASASVRFCTPSFSYTRAACTFTVLSTTPSAAAISFVALAGGELAQDAHLAWRERHARHPLGELRGHTR